MKNFRILSALAAMSLLLLLSCSKDSAPDYSKDSAPDNARDRTYLIISDLHLGDQRALNDGYGWNRTMRDTLAAFLDYLEEDSGWDELVVAGDMMDEWVLPTQYLTFADEEGNLLSEQAFFKKIVEANPKVFDGFRQLSKSGHRLVYIPGNHDMQTTEADFSECLPGVFDQARTKGVDGMGEYCPDDEIYIEHGHRYDIMNAPYIGKVGVDGIPSGSILPPGFFVSRLNVDRKMEAAKNPDAGTGDVKGVLDYLSYDVMWAGMGLLLGQKPVVTMTDGMEKTYEFGDYAGSDARLFKNIDDYQEENDGWNARCRRLGAFFVPEVITSLVASAIYDVCDAMGLTVLEETDLDAHILVWGHSHEPKLIASDGSLKGKVIYVNTGCWADGKVYGAENTGYFGKIVKKADGKTYEVSLCRFLVDGAGNGHVKTVKKDTIVL